MRDVLAGRWMDGRFMFGKPPGGPVYTPTPTEHAEP